MSKPSRMTYYIDVNDKNLVDFLQIIQTLKNLGVINSFESIGDWVTEGKEMPTETLLSLLSHAQKDVSEGRVLPIEEVKKQARSWKKK